MDNRAFSNLIRRAARIAREKADVQGELTDVFEARYGCTYSDVDADALIEILDYGHGDRPPSVAEVDKIMADAGAPKKE